MTREELDRLHARAMSVEPLDGPLVTCPELLTLIAQARRAIDLEERLRRLGTTYCGKFVDMAAGDYSACARELGHDGDCRRTR